MQGASSSSFISCLSHSHVTSDLEWCDRIKLSNLLLAGCLKRWVSGAVPVHPPSCPVCRSPIRSDSKSNFAEIGFLASGIGCRYSRSFERV